MSQDTIPEFFRQRIQAAKEKQLEELDLSNAKITQIPDEVLELTHLKILNLKWNKIQKSLAHIVFFSNLTWLDLSNNQLSTLPDSFSNLSNLTWLDLSNNRLSTLPESITNLFNLTTLDLSNNRLSTLPNSFSNLSKLTWLYLSNNHLSTLPNSFSNLSKLIRLYLSNNRLSTLPNSFSNLFDLTRVNLSNNQLSTLPNSFSNLSNLTWLNLSNNQLSTLPDFITTLSNLTRLFLCDNPLETPPIEITEKGIEAIREYFRQLKDEGTDYIYEAKLLIVGEGSAGKTTLAKKIEDPDYQLDKNEKSTEGIDITKWGFPLDNEREFKVNIWDFGGQEIYHTTHQFFLTKRSLYALVADTRKEDTDFYYWLNVVELLSNNSPLLIIKNEKEDRYIDIDENSLRGRFENLKESLATNLKTNRGLDKILTKIQHFIQDLPHVGSALPKTWKRVREALEQDQRNYISLEEYLNICQDNDFIRREAQLQLSGYLHDLGVCLHFQDSPLLRNTVILKPEWGTDAVYKVLDDKQVIKNLGKFTTKDLDKIWSDEQYLFKQAELLELMMRFKLCYQIPGTPDTYIAPQLLTKTKPQYDWDETDNLILRYTYEFMPKGIITQLIVAMHQHIEQQQYVWRSGVYLYKDETDAEVIEYYELRELKIRLSGKFKKDLLTIITNELDNIHSSYQRLKYQKLIPCNCQRCQHSQEPYFYPFDILRSFARDGDKIQCQQSRQMVDALSLIDDVIIRYSSERSDSMSNTPQTTTNIEQHFYGNVGTATGTIEGNQHSGDTKMTGDRNINQHGKGYNIAGDNIADDKIMGDKNINQSRNLTISDNTQVNTSGAASFNMGDISGTVANTINQLPSFDNEPNKKELKELLIQLQTAVLETDLDTEEQEESLEQINAIAESLHNPQDIAVKKSAKRAMKMLVGTAAMLPSNADLVAICHQLPDLMGKVF